MEKIEKITNHYMAIAVTFVFVFVFGSGLGYLIAYLSAIQPSYIPLVSAILGLLVAFSIPLWQALFVNAPKLSVEINAIKRTVSDSAIICIDDEPELRPLKPPRESVPFLILGGDDSEFARPGKRANKGGYTLSETEELLSDAKQRLRDLPSQIEERKKELDRVNSLIPTTLTKYECDRLNGPITP
ncbi:MAG: hypothetical protein LUQ11_15845, partial [Methylococcaceae bacterium]|nr:hypothetical protein [Methylococcaceae bacterium]